MPTNRSRRARVGRADLDPYKCAELLEGPGCVLLAGQGYLARIAGHGAWGQTWQDATQAERAAVLAEMLADWRDYGPALLAWCVGADAVGAPPTAHFAPTEGPGGRGTRPWAWWTFDAPADRREGETDMAFLRRHRLLLPGEA